MANPEHIALIKQGAAVWNSWYKKHKKVIPDLAKANLHNLSLSGINLKRADLNHANFSNTDLTKAQLTNANLRGANFRGADLQNANLKGANLDYVIFFQAKINAKTIISLKSRHVWEIVNNHSPDKNFAGYDLSNSNLFHADLSNADLRNAKLENVNFTNANLSNAYLYRADLTSANFQNADLKNAYFSHANLTNAYLGGASCCGTYFQDAELQFANFKTTKLSHKTMIDSKWYSVWEIVNRGAVKKNLSGADLSNANLQGVNFEEANLTNANLSHAILRRSNLERANLTNTALIGANICGVDLEQANLKGTKLKSVIGDRDTQLPLEFRSSKTNLIVQERPESKISSVNTPQIDTAVNVSPDQTKSNNKSKPNNSIAIKDILLFLGLIGVIITGYYFVLYKNPDLPSPQTLQSWKQKLEQLIPAN